VDCTNLVLLCVIGPSINRLNDSDICDLEPPESSTFALRHLNKLGVSTAQGIRVFAIATLFSNGAYLLFAFGYARLIGVI